MDVVVQRETNKSFKITVDIIKREIRLKIKERASLDEEEFAIKVVEKLSEIDFSGYSNLRGRFKFIGENIILKSNRSKKERKQGRRSKHNLLLTIDSNDEVSLEEINK
jgi:hypothetical protein